MRAHLRTCTCACHDVSMYGRYAICMSYSTFNTEIMQTTTVIEYSPMDPYSGSYHQPPVDGHSQQSGYQQGPASFVGHSAAQNDPAEGYQYSAYQAQPSSHRYHGGGLLQTHYNGPRSPVYGHTSGYGATASVSL